MNCRCLLFLLLSAGSLVAPAQQPLDIYQKIKKEVDARQYSEAIVYVKELNKSEEKSFRLNNYDYLLARLSEKTGDIGAAAAGYQAVIGRNSILREYALWHLAELMRSGGNLVLERIYLNQLAVTAPDSLFQIAVKMRLAESFFESGNFPAAIGQLQKFQSASSGKTTAATPAPDNIVGKLTGNDPRSRKALVLLGQAFLQNKQPAEARQIFNSLVNNLSDPAMPDDFALAGARALDQMDGVGVNESAGKAIDEAEHNKRAAIYTFNRDFAAARIHYKALINNYPHAASIPNALYQVGRGLMQDGINDEAIPWFERVQSEYPNDPLAADALSQAASAYSRAKKPNEAVTRYKQFIAMYPASETLDRAYLNIIDVLRDDGEPTKALEWANQVREKFNGKLPATLALFSQAKILMTQNEWARALTAFEELRQQNDLGGVKVPGGTSKTEIAFLHALVLEKLERYSEAANEFLAIPEGRSEYYGWRATQHLRAMAKNETSAPVIVARHNVLKNAALDSVAKEQFDSARKDAQSALRLSDDATSRTELIEILRRCYAALPGYREGNKSKVQNFGRKEILRAGARAHSEENLHQEIADELLFLGLEDEGVPELEFSLRRKNSLPLSKVSGNPLSEFSPDVAYTLALLYLRADIPFRATAYAEPLWRKIPDDHLLELAQRDYVEMMYPVPYRESLVAEAETHGVDPRYILSIMRQESRYRPEVKSYAAARGLMQFIYPTADTTAKQLGKQNFDQDELYHPETAILFGAQYLKTIFEQFPNQPEAVAASYNGGETNMARWLKRAHSTEGDQYVPEIVFSQSKDYVYKVMTNYRIYRELYDSKLKPVKSQ